jgi:RHS repeat-associated protein
MVEVTSGSGESLTTVEGYQYDGTSRRIQIFSDFDGGTPDKVQDDYHSNQQVIETDVTTDGSRNGGYQTIWSPRYIDAAVLRDSLNTADTGIATAERVFYLADANYNATGLAKCDSEAGEWQTAERYSYTPYGAVSYRNTDWSVAASSANANTVLYTGRTLDLLTGLHYYRARYYDAGLERFINRDPIAYEGKDFNLYRYGANRPTTTVDPLGHQVAVPGWDCLPGAAVCPPEYFPPNIPGSVQTPPPPPRIRQENGCCRPLTVGSIVNRANQALAQPKCLAWFVAHGLKGPVQWNVRCHGKGKPFCWAFPSWTAPGFAIGLCENWLDSTGDVAFASLIIHELAHHYCPLGPGREDCAISAQDACEIP